MVNNKIFVFVGLLIVGFFMLGLVSGAGYNLVVPSADPPADPGSSGGGGGGGTIANVTDNETVAGGNVTGEKGVSEGDEKITSDVDEGAIAGEGVISYLKQFWVWVSVTAVLIVVLIVYLRKRNSVYSGKKKK